MNNQVIKQAIGIDVAQKELVVTIGRLYSDLSIDLFARRVYHNTLAGFKQLVKWVENVTDTAVERRYVMEATGVYHEKLAHFLIENNSQISVVLPSKISNYMRTLDIKTITDKTSADAIARFGLERKLDNWEKPSGVYGRIRQLTREREQLIEQRTITKNQLHAEQSEAWPNSSTLKRIQQHIEFMDMQEKEIVKELTALIQTDQSVSNAIELLCTISGIGKLTACTVLGETNGFELIRNKRQLTSFAGLDVIEKQSGTSVKSKPRLSKKGNRHLRKAFYLPALSVIRSDDHFKDIFNKLVARHGIKKKAIAAIQRKLLEMTFIIFKKQVPYDKLYYKKLESCTSTTL
ncbi:Transposase [Chitinophaga terrae (ex Kim and Jung 2007)]|jgi:transposase|uniref:Transposase n=2 Tax=Chitinophaga terrae (ex Kim and Jung 2007) TaxID=408074 RepID=A0A1H4GVF1_9BACT|nr:IS110 family transposase [Chitinophaga terrae (ex Kim and Jung 2007)]GEP93738.1 IS110 family transposase [Chitinophaga terrae (ex Kim and Jung 2007)]SEB12848.1 Transposase [Chitinophaga terrae (ex Kim and Jung 2007)]